MVDNEKKKAKKENLLNYDSGILFQILTKPLSNYSINTLHNSHAISTLKTLYIPSTTLFALGSVVSPALSSVVVGLP